MSIRSSSSSAVCVSVSNNKVLRRRSSGVSLAFLELKISRSLRTMRYKGVRCCSCVSNSAQVKVGTMAELVEKKEEAVAGGDVSVAAGGGGHSRTFLEAQNEKELLSGIRKEAEAGKLPANVAAGLGELYKNYRAAVLQSGNPRAEEIILSNMALVFDRVLFDVEEPFTFSAHHKAVRGPFDYYNFGQNYIKPLIDFRNSYVGNISLFSDIEEKLLQGHNVILISNHQTEADPAVLALMLETTNRHIAEAMTYVAGDRVITDPLCKPFSIGRHLFCVYSKKHMNDNPELADIKRRANTRSLKEMTLLLRSGSQIIWIAPSGGRDRPHPSTQEWFPAPFDAPSVDSMRRLAAKTGVPGHIYPLAMLSHDIMPPPAQVEKEIGEQRMLSFSGVGLSVGAEINYNDITNGISNPEEARTAYSEALYSSVNRQYKVLNSAIHGNQGLKVSNSDFSLSQPWQ